MDPDNSFDDSAEATPPAAPAPRRSPRRRRADPVADAPSGAGAPSEADAAPEAEAAPTSPAPTKPTNPAPTSPAPTSPAPTNPAGPTTQLPAAGSGEPPVYSQRDREFRIGEPRPSPQTRPTAEIPRTPPSPRHQAAPPPTVYRARRPAVAGALIIPAVVAGLLLLRALAIAAFGTTFHIAGVIASCLGLAALPLLVSGLYGLLTGAAYGAEQSGFKVWARPPLAYLVVGLVFVLAAGLAIS